MTAPSLQFSAKDQPGHKTLKLRKHGQMTQDELRAKDLKAELEDRERKHYESKGKDDRRRREELEDRQRLQIEYSSRDAKKKRDEEEEEKNIDADDSDSSEEEDDSSDSEDDSEDETAELMRELEKIKKEREEEKKKQEEEMARLEAQKKDNEVKFGNPLLNISGEAGDFNVKRRWYEDVVFKNQARDEPERKKRFINDTIRNDFHKKFLAKYIQ